MRVAPGLAGYASCKKRSRRETELSDAEGSAACGTVRSQAVGIFSLSRQYLRSNWTTLASVPGDA
jgi:hypothetical protein